MDLSPQHQSLTPDQAKARLLSWAQASDDEKAANSSHVYLKAALIGGGVALATSLLKRAGVTRIASLLFLTRGLPLVLRGALKSALRGARTEPAI